MLGPAEQEKIRTVIKTHWFIFFAYTTALIMYTFVLFVVTRGRSPNEAFQAGILRSLFIGLSVALGGAKFMIQSRLLFEEVSYTQCKSLDEITGKYMRYNFIMLALCEVPALLGLIITFLTMRMDEWWVFFGISAVMFATSAPRLGKLESIAEAHAARYQSTG